MFIASLETRNFSFTSVGESEQEARESLQAGLDEHAKQYGLPSDWTDIYDDCVSVTELPKGGCLRDGQLLTGSVPKKKRTP